MMRFTRKLITVNLSEPLTPSTMRISPSFDLPKMESNNVLILEIASNSRVNGEDERDGARGRAAIDTTSVDEVIELEDVVLWEGIAITLDNITTDTLEEPTEGDGLVTAIILRVEIEQGGHHSR
ncbi:hypothetical protein BHE74_00001344 [Ensete ventricosum]|nr:hypothetical protein BHE74_00001344 [Ensete ventricosum]